MINQGGNYKTQAHEFYAELKSKSLNFNSEDSAMYWGKLKVNESAETDLKNYQDVIAHNKEIGKDTHIYISDYHHFWVAKVESVHHQIHNKSDTLAFYDNKDVDVWFRITDMDLIAGEFEETLYYLSGLFVDNKFCTEKIDSIHPYLGGLKFPMIVEDNLDENYFRSRFSEDAQRLSRENPLIEKNFLCDHVTTHMKSFVLPPQVFSKLSHNVKKELLSVEMSLAEKENGSNLIFENVLNSYLRILESVMNETLGKILNSQYGECLFISDDGERFSDHAGPNTSLLGKYNGYISMNAFLHLLSDVTKFGNLSLESTNDKFPEMVDYFTNTLIPFIEEKELVSMRSAFKRGEKVTISKEMVFHLRNQILGVGCVGVINTLITILFNSEQEYFLKKAA